MYTHSGKHVQNKKISSRLKIVCTNDFTNFQIDKSIKLESFLVHFPLSTFVYYTIRPSFEPPYHRIHRFKSESKYRSKERESGGDREMVEDGETLDTHNQSLRCLFRSRNHRNVFSSASVSISHHFQMTPLPRWVLLSLLLATVAAHPVHHACVHLCHARNTTSPEITGVCDHHRDHLVLQSGAARSPYLFVLCLTPCHGAASPDTLRYDDTPVCRAFRESLVERHVCSCRHVDRDERARKLDGEQEEEKEEEEEEEDRGRRAEELERYRLNEIDGTASRKIDERWSVPLLPSSVGDQRGISEENLSGRSEEMGIDTSSAEKNATADNLSPNDSPMDEDSMDWDLWCISQCDNGKGGSACHCDIIP